MSLGMVAAGYISMKRNMISQKEYQSMNYLPLLSRATYFRHQKLAFEQFVSFFE